MLTYASCPPRTVHGQTKWLVLLGPRQMGKSLTAAFCGYSKAAYIPGYDQVIIADTKDRADYLHKRIHFLHNRWAHEVRSPTVPSRETRQLTFDSDYGGRMRVLSGAAGAVGIGQSIDFLHASEVGYWPDAGGQWSLINPAIINRDECMVMLECTPVPSSAPSSIWWKDTCADAKKGQGRWLYKFVPFWDSQLNVRPWPKGSAFTNEELDLLNRYQHLGLRPENLAFRRFTLESDREITRNPDLFMVYYPLDDVTCWIASTGGVIHKSVLERHLKKKLVEHTDAYMEFEPPEPQAQYVIGVDPAGYAARDHAAFQVLKVYENEWKQVACYADTTDPVTFSRQLLKVATRYNKALVAVESNGVGVAVIALMQEAGYRNMFSEVFGKPGIHTSSQLLDKLMGFLIDALMDQLNLSDEDTVKQLLGYGDDKKMEDGVRQEMRAGGTVSKGKRSRHHWDLVSALLMAVRAARSMPRRTKLGSEDTTVSNVVPFSKLTYDETQRYREEVQARKRVTSKKRRSKYRRRRK